MRQITALMPAAETSALVGLVRAGVPGALALNQVADVRVVGRTREAAFRFGHGSSLPAPPGSGKSKIPERGHSCPQQFPNAGRAGSPPKRYSVRTLLRTGMSALRSVCGSAERRPSLCAAAAAEA